MSRLTSGSDYCSSPIATAASTTVSFWRELLFYVRDGRYGESPVFSKDIRKRSYLYFLSLILYLWNKPHYRFGTFEEDMIKNLRNVALPGTGVPLSWAACNRLTMVFLLFFGQPLLCLLYAAVLSKERSVLAITAKYQQLLLEPEEWFFYWRLNCRLASYHAFLTKTPGYQMEDKWKFLLEAEKKEIPVSPFLHVPGLVVKDRYEEGGMGINFFKNATEGEGQALLLCVFAVALVPKYLL